MEINLKTEKGIAGEKFSTQKLFHLSRMSVLRQVEDLLQRIDDPITHEVGISIACSMHIPKIEWHCERCYKAGFVGVAA